MLIPGKPLERDLREADLGRGLRQAGFSTAAIAFIDFFITLTIASSMMARNDYKPIIGIQLLSVIISQLLSFKLRLKAHFVTACSRS